MNFRFRLSKNTVNLTVKKENMARIALSFGRSLFTFLAVFYAR